MNFFVSGILISIICMSASATESLLTLQHKKAESVFQAAQFVYNDKNCFYSEYRHGQITDSKNNFYPGYFYQFSMQGDGQTHRQCLENVRLYFAGRIFHLDSFLLSKDEH